MVKYLEILGVTRIISLYSVLRWYIFTHFELTGLDFDEPDGLHRSEMSGDFVRGQVGQMSQFSYCGPLTGIEEDEDPQESDSDGFTSLNSPSSILLNDKMREGFVPSLAKCSKVESS